MDKEGLWGPATELVFVHSARLGNRGAAFASAKRELERRLSGLGLTVSSHDSRDGYSSVVVAEFRRFVPIERVRAAVAAVARAHPHLTIEETGDISADQAQHRLTDNDLKRAEILSVPVTLAVLLFAFGGLVAALVPVVLALTAVGAAFGLLGPISQVFPVQDSAKTVILLIGMAVGVDYALFYVVRSREERRRGASSHQALETTSRTSGRTVIVSGTTVAIAMAGMFISGAKVLNGIAAGTIAVVACAVAGSVTVLPAILELLGPRIDRGRVPFLPHLRTEGSGRFWSAIVTRVLRRPLLWAALATAFLLALAYPALSLHVSKPSDQALSSQHDSALQALAAVRRAFPGAGEPALVAVRAPASSRVLAQSAIQRLRRLALSTGIAHAPVTITSNRSRTAAALYLPLAGNGANATSRRAVEKLRERLVPATLGRVPGAETAVTGKVAEDIDFTNQIRDSLPYVIAFVLVLAFGLLLVAFRSLVVPLKAIVLNLLSVGASYGVLALVFEHHWAEPILGFKSNGAIIAWLPLFLFVVLFGLSMDYHVFILSRVREAVDRGESTEDAVRHSVGVTAGVVTGAALVMVAVFALFGTLSSLDLKQAGVGLATAVLIDATVIRAVLLPTSMKLLGERNWYLPRSLKERLPSMQLEAR
jgi:RND superfamily putative drug exporter